MTERERQHLKDAYTGRVQSAGYSISKSLKRYVSGTPTDLSLDHKYVDNNKFFFPVGTCTVS